MDCRFCGNRMTSGLSLSGVSIGYDRQVVATGVDGVFPLGRATAIVGPNGAGKSTLLKTLCGLIDPLKGQIGFQDCARDDIAYLPQRADIDRSFPVTARDLVALGRWRETGSFRTLSPEGHRAVGSALQRVGLEDVADRPIERLSIGQFQRALFARLMVQDAPIVLLDEPFAAMDSATTRDLLALMVEWRDTGKTIIAALHDLDQVRAYFTDMVLIDHGILGWGAVADILDRAGHMHFHAAADCYGSDPRA
jgi:zinc/manganese transport system ATP-binding protein